MNRLDSDIQAIVADLLPEGEEELLQQIEERLENMNPEEHRRLRFDLAKQRMDEDPERYKNRLHKYYEETLLQDEQKFIENT